MFIELFHHIASAGKQGGRRDPGQRGNKTRRIARIDIDKLIRWRIGDRRAGPPVVRDAGHKTLGGKDRIAPLVGIAGRGRKINNAQHFMEVGEPPVIIPPEIGGIQGRQGQQAVSIGIVLEPVVQGIQDMLRLGPGQPGGSVQDDYVAIACLLDEP